MKIVWANGFISAMLLMLIEVDPAETLEKELSALIQLQWTASKMRVTRSNVWDSSTQPWVNGLKRNETEGLYNRVVERRKGQTHSHNIPGMKEEEMETVRERRVRQKKKLFRCVEMFTIRLYYLTW